MLPACLLICNDVEPQALNDFQNWYQQEHLAERLGLKGFLSARRYAALEASHQWSAIYELSSVDVLNSTEYLQRLEEPSERTRAIMPQFRRTVRCGLELVQDVGVGVGGILDILVLKDIQTLPEHALRWWAKQTLFERLRLYRAPISADFKATDTREGKMRLGVDTVWATVLMIEWSSIQGEGLQSIGNQAKQHGLNLVSGQGGRFRLINLRN